MNTTCTRFWKYRSSVKCGNPTSNTHTKSNPPEKGHGRIRGYSWINVSLGVSRQYLVKNGPSSRRQAVDEGHKWSCAPRPGHLAPEASSFCQMEACENISNHPSRGHSRLPENYGSSSTRQRTVLDEPSPRRNAHVHHDAVHNQPTINARIGQGHREPPILLNHSFALSTC